MRWHCLQIEIQAIVRAISLQLEEAVQEVSGLINAINNRNAKSASGEYRWKTILKGTRRKIDRTLRACARIIRTKFLRVSIVALEVSDGEFSNGIGPARRVSARP